MSDVAKQFGQQYGGWGTPLAEQVCLIDGVWRGVPDYFLDFPTLYRKDLFDQFGLTMIAILPFVVMFLVTSIAMLRERTSGTLERLLTTPLARFDLLLGYGVAFGVMALLQAGITVTVATTLYDLDVAGSLWLVVLIAGLDDKAVVGKLVIATKRALTPYERDIVQLFADVLQKRIVDYNEVAELLHRSFNIPTVLRLLDERGLRRAE